MLWCWTHRRPCRSRFRFWPISGLAYEAEVNLYDSDIDDVDVAGVVNVAVFEEVIGRVLPSKVCQTDPGVDDVDATILVYIAKWDDPVLV